MIRRSDSTCSPRSHEPFFAAVFFAAVFFAAFFAVDFFAAVFFAAFFAVVFFAADFFAADLFAALVVAFFADAFLAGAVFDADDFAFAVFFIESPGARSRGECRVWTSVMTQRNVFYGRSGDDGKRSCDAPDRPLPWACVQALPDDDELASSLEASPASVALVARPS
ncbi:hypothetical protein [Nannocystis exedens]|uniref:hypothetical protein n=1 Tax=Nannocystis exedens TaxID=54 RepID=UPI0014741518|nr:hypothetical protein [Nannocystis exedens]